MSQNPAQSSNSSSNRWSGLKSGGKKLWDRGWEVTGKYIGEPANKLVVKWGIESFWPSTIEKELDKAARILRVFTIDGGLPVTEKLNEADPSAAKKKQKIFKKIPPAVIEGAKGIAIFTVFRTGLHWSAASGSGVVITRLPDGSWSAPSGILIHTLGIGLVIGIDIYDIVLVLNTDAAVRQFAHPRVKLGGEVTVAAGPVGEGRQLDVSRSASWSYVKSKGFYAGAQLDGTIIIERNDENALFYGQRLTAAEILAGKAAPPAAAQGLYQVLAAAVGKPIGYDRIPEGLGPSEHHDDFVAAQQNLDHQGPNAYGQESGLAPPLDGSNPGYAPPAYYQPDSHGYPQDYKPGSQQDHQQSYSSGYPQHAPQDYPQPYASRPPQGYPQGPSQQHAPLFPNAGSQPHPSGNNPGTGSSYYEPGTGSGGPYYR